MIHTYYIIRCVFTVTSPPLIASRHFDLLSDAQAVQRTLEDINPKWCPMVYRVTETTTPIPRP